ncbi:MAG: sigma-70 family RNA polymerase sigma factor [Alphaproteobacteria bacterium]|nr:sigma-70 family RNA polymerase sigma factor [Alphaproteobacteria bacterium]
MDDGFDDLYAHLRSLARRIHGERGHGQQTLDPTALLHEAWAKVSAGGGAYASRGHFVAVAARAMRQVLIDRARARSSQKRGVDPARTTLAGLADDGLDAEGFLAMDQALEDLREVDPVAADVVLLRVYGGASVPEVAEQLGVSASTVDRTWRFARAFLTDRLG